MIYGPKRSAEAGPGLLRAGAAFAIPETSSELGGALGIAVLEASPAAFAEAFALTASISAAVALAGALLAALVLGRGERRPFSPPAPLFCRLKARAGPVRALRSAGKWLACREGRCASTT